MITLREYYANGEHTDMVIEPWPPPENEREEEHPGMSWHPILFKWVPDADIDKTFSVTEEDLEKFFGEDEDAEE